ncbi:erythronolide synthase [Candidatus Vecturithrix granuli]|uniref:Erythronolide synthase n=1 Tax=Vecturithrix granuli TaxID=1499967 RepID=A0A081C720_VECG1|nr:erythronolide synthase [Candidatus Vecturithrix granuli]
MAKEQQHSEQYIHSVPIAIIGMGCLFPKARNLQEYWINIREGVDAITEIPATHWNPDDYFHSDPKAPDKTYARCGGFLPTIDFNPLEFGIVPNALEATDTSQLLSLVVAQEALRDAGYLDREFNRARTSVILGVTGAQELVIPLGARLGHPIWRKALRDAGLDEAITQDVVERIGQGYVEWQENSFPGLLGNVIAGRIANRFDLGGTNCAVDAACASSLSAVHLAMLELASDQADMVLTGGVDAFNHVFMYMCFSKTPALSPSGHARPFDHQCDGTALGEGIGIMVLKRLEDARRDGDKVYAIIKGIGSSSDGKGNSIYAPSAEGQMRAFRKTYALAGITPDTIELMEAHGTGTKAGDAAEIRSMTEVYKAAQKNGSWCALGSVKSQIGHTKSAAGVAGLIKAALALHHKVLPPTIKVEKPAPALEDGKTPFYVNTVKRPWLPVETHPRRAAVSSFGFGGSNFHCVLEEYLSRKPAIDWSGTTQILTFSADQLPELQAKLQAIEPQLSWPKLRSKAAQLRQQFDAKQTHRLVLVVEQEKTDFAKILKNAQVMLDKNQGKTSWSTPDGIFYGKGPVPGKLGVIFPGQGSQYVGMLRDLSCQFPQFQEILETANRVFQQGQNPSEIHRLSDLIYPHPTFTEEEHQKNAAVLQSTQIAQPAIGAVSLGLLKILQYFGIQPEEVAGHSYGELVALCAAGVLDTDTFFAMSKLRGQLMGQKSGDKGSMLAVQGDLNFVKQILEEEQIDLVIANKNSPQQTVLSGATKEVERAANVMKERGIRCKHLNVAAAFHSSFVADASGAFLEALKQIEIHAPTMPVYADSTAELYPDDIDQIRELLAGQLANPVDFIGIIENMYASGVRTFFEVGPSSQMNGLIKAILEGKEVETFAVDTSGGKRSGESDLARALSQLAASGYYVRIAAWDEHAPIFDENATVSKKQAMVIPLSGANYFKPKPSKPPVTRKIVTMPDNGAGIQTPLATSSVSSQPPGAAQKTAFPSGEKMSQNDRAKPISQVSTSVSSSPVSSSQATLPVSFQQPAAIIPPVPPKSPTITSLDLSEALRMTQENLRTLQKFQQQSADLHRQFLEGQEATRQTFDRLFSQQQNLLLGTFTQAVSQVAPQTEVQIVQPFRLSRQTPEPATPAVQVEQTSSQPVAPAAPLESQTPPAMSEPELSEPNLNVKPVTTTPASDTTQVESVLLDVVSEKTGYPIDMLDLEMGLDADLGIDSIKRVEILSALQEQLPDVPEIRADQIGKLQTLRQIVELLGVGRPTPPTPVSVGMPSVDSGQVEKVLLDVVAEKTGYPQEMLDLDMGLDADLGIDSIKRVEILSALQHQLPGVPEISSDQLGQIQNLRQIVDFLSVSVVTPPHQKSAKSDSVKSKTDGVDANQVKTVLLQVVSEKTGYPEEMLDLDMGLDADLGIDSIKRVEILSALQHQLPEAPEIGSDQIGEIQNLRQIVEFLTRASHISLEQLDLQPHTQSEPEPEIKMSASEASASELERNVIVPITLVSPDTRKQIALESGSTIWITEDGTGFSVQLASRLQQQGFQTQCLALSQIAEATVPESLRGLILLAPPSETFLPSFLNEAFVGLQHAGVVLRRQPAVFMTVSRLDGRFGFGSLNPAVNPISGGLAGLAKTAGREWSQVQSKALDLSPEIKDMETIADAIVDELLRIGPAEVGITPQGRIILQLEPQPLVSGVAAGRLSHKDVIVVSGGARGVTAACALAMAQTWQPTMILFGRSPAPAPEPSWLAGLTDETDIKQGIICQAGRKLGPKEVGQSYQRIMANREILRTLANLEATGAKAIYRSVDVRDAKAVKSILNEIQEQCGPITGLVHGAGVLADKRIEDKTVEQFDRVYGTKVEGALNLLAGLQSNPLKILVFFSSTTARLGRIGQVDYAVANEVLNKIAQQQARLRPDCRVVAVNWGPWAGGMVTPALEKIFASEGIGLIPLQAGAHYLVQELSLTPASAPVEIVVLNRESRKTVPEVQIIPSQSASATQIPQVSSTEVVMHVAFERTLTITEYPFLASHVINGRAVLPMAMSIEWMAHAALHNHPGLLLHGFNDLRMLKGIALQRKESYPIRVLVGEATKRDDVFRIPVEMRGVTSAGQDVLHVRADFLLSTKLQQGQRTINGLATGTYPHQNGDLYHQYLFHGPDFHGIEQVEAYAVNGIVAKVKAAPHPSSWIKQPLRTYWLTDPLVIDSGFQLLILWSFAQRQAGSLPAYIGQYRQFNSKFSPEGGRIVAKVTTNEQHHARATIEFLDLNGNLLARMEEYECTIDSSLNQAFRKNTLEI